jgi:hypothetical protein
MLGVVSGEDAEDCSHMLCKNSICTSQKTSCCAYQHEQVNVVCGDRCDNHMKALWAERGEFFDVKRRFTYNYVCVLRMSMLDTCFDGTW